jgi:branched-chain amino acid transport system permease protein
MSELDHRQIAIAAIFIGLLAALPLLGNHFLLTVMTLVFLHAVVGIAWNLMMGYAGQLSLGHALYFGIGAYIVAILSERYGITPWIGMGVAVIIPALCGVVIGILGFRFGVRGVYFALLTIAFAEAARIVFEHWDYVGKTGGFFLSALNDRNRPLLSLRGGAVFFYYALLATMLAAWAVSVALIRSRLGYTWRAIREDEEAARAIGVEAFKVKLIAVGVSAGMTGVAGGWFALINGSLFPDTVLGMRLSIDLIIAPIVGGLGTLFGPILGAFIVVPLNELAKELGQASGVNGLNLLIYGVLLLVVVLVLPNGCWPWLARIFGLAGPTKSGKEGQP